MGTKNFSRLRIAILALAVTSLACQSAGLFATETPTPTATATATATATLTPTATKKPTVTPRPTATPNLAATQQFEDFFSQVQEYKNQGYISDTKGTYVALQDFKKSWAQLGWSRQWLLILQRLNLQ